MNEKAKSYKTGNDIIVVEKRGNKEWMTVEKDTRNQMPFATATNVQGRVTFTDALRGISNMLRWI